MALVLNEEQRLLKDSASGFLAESAPVGALRALRDSNDPLGYSAPLWQQMVELGWSGVVLPEAYGGLEFGFLGLGAIFEECGRNLSASRLFGTLVLGASALVLGGSDQQKASLLPQVAAGQLTLALALEESPHHAPAQCALEAKPHGDGWVLNGAKQFVLDGHSADQLIVVARSSGTPPSTSGLSLFIIAADTAGIRRTRTTMIDSRNAADITFDNVIVPAGSHLGTIDQGWDLLEPVLDRGRIALAAEMLGGCQEVFERTLAYLKQREQFGVKIGSFQALKHRAALMYIELELSRSVVLDALSAIDDRRPDLPMVASLAKAKLNDTYHLITNEAVQMHGGIGVTDELDIGLFLKRARVLEQALGNTGFHRDRYATLSGY